MVNKFKLHQAQEKPLWILQEEEKDLTGCPLPQRKSPSAIIKARTDRDTGSVEPGLRPIFGSVSGSENQFWGIYDWKDTFCLYYRLFFGSLDTEPVSWFWFWSIFCGSVLALLSPLKSRRRTEIYLYSSPVAHKSVEKVVWNPRLDASAGAYIRTTFKREICCHKKW